MIENWQALLAQLEVIDSSFGSEIWSEEDFQAFEIKTGIILPTEYKEFCQVFGTGCFGDFVSIFCPNIQLSNICLEAIKDEITEFPHQDLEKMLDRKSLIQLLDSAFVFGTEPRANSIFWDLRTYSELDKSYDIYWANSDCFDGEIYQVGRNFSEFVRDFCLGTKSYEILPERKHPLPEALQPTFTRVKPNW